MTQKNPSGPPVTFIDDPHAPEVFISETAGAALGHGVVHLTFASSRVNHETTPGPINRVVNLRVAMPVPAAQYLAATLYDFLKSHGLDPVPRPEDVQIQ